MKTKTLKKRIIKRFKPAVFKSETDWAAAMIDWLWDHAANEKGGGTEFARRATDMQQAYGIHSHRVYDYVAGRASK